MAISPVVPIVALLIAAAAMPKKKKRKTIIEPPPEPEAVHCSEAPEDFIAQMAAEGRICDVETGEWVSDPSQVQPPAPPSLPAIAWTDEANWMIPDAWWAEVGTPKLQDRIMPLMDQWGAGLELDPLVLAHDMLFGETGPYPLPTTASPPTGGFWQTVAPEVVVPGTSPPLYEPAPDYFDGPETVLGLMYHLGDHVFDALMRVEQGDELYLTP